MEIIPKEQNIIPAIFENKEIRIIQKNGEPWFVAKDVAEILEIKNVSDAVKDLDSDEKDIVLNDTLGGVQEMLILSESGLYSLIMRSRKPVAKPFQKWITREVLPAIRKHGFYIPEKLVEKPNEPLLNTVATITQTREAMIDIRRKLIATIGQFLFGHKWQEDSMQTQMSRLYQYCHIAMTLNTAQGVIGSRVRKNNGKVIIHSYAKMTKRKSYTADYLVAINYYNEDELKTFLTYFNDSLRLVVQHINAIHIKATSNSVIQMLKDIGRDLIRRTTQLNISDQISTKHRAKFNELLSQLLDDKLQPIEFLEECAKLEDGLAFVI